MIEEVRDLLKKIDQIDELKEDLREFKETRDNFSSVNEK